MKKILFLIPTLGGGGAEKVLVNLANKMNKDIFDITIMTLFDVGENRKYLSENVKYKYIFKRIFRGNIHILKLFSPQFLFEKMIKEEYDVMVSYLEGPTTRIIAGAKNPNVKLINYIHNEFYDTNELIRSYRSLKELERCYQRYDGTVFVSKTAKKAFEQCMPLIQNNLQVLYNTVDTDLIIEKSNDSLNDNIIKNNSINIISVGRFIHQKGFERLIKIISKLVYEDKLRIHLNLLGKGNLEERYRLLIKEYKLENFITLLGYKENPYKYVKNSDLFVCSSYYEGYSTAVTEALIVGTPVITTLCSGMQELLGDNNDYGIIVENNDRALYEGMKYVLKNADVLADLKVKAEKRSAYFQAERTVKSVEDYILKQILA